MARQQTIYRRSRFSAGLKIAICRPSHPLAEAVGFTLLEVVAVMLIIGIISAIVISRLVITDNALVEHTEVIKAHLRYAQTRAMNSSTPFSIRFLSATTYAMYASGADAPELLPGEDSIVVQLPQRVRVDDGDADSDAVSFNSWGQPCTDEDALVLQNDTRTMRVTVGTENRTIEIHKNTGFIP